MRLLSTLQLASAQAGANLTLASTAWLVSGLTASPLLNSLLPALGTVPILIRLQRDPRGYGLELMAVLILIGVSFEASVLQLRLLGCFAAVLLFGLGQEMSQLILQRQMIASSGVSMTKLRSGQEVGAVCGNLLAALLFPAIRQFGLALVLLMPLALRGRKNPSADDALPTVARQPPPLDVTCGLQGLVLGALFALLALWVREVGEGRCLDFAMVLTAYGIGRALAPGLPSVARPLRYLILVLILVCSQLVPQAWIAVGLFIPIGALVGAADLALVESLHHLGDAPLRWQVLQRSGAVGGLFGSLGLGVLCQLFGLSVALPLVCTAFTLLALVSWRQQRLIASP